MIYDEFQKKAIDLVEKGNSVIVCAPTGAGKTVIAEYVIDECIRKNKGVIYTAPIKALSNQKFRDFNLGYPEKIGIVTGDVSLNSSAPVLIMTTEIFRNTLLDDPQRLKHISWVIFDEIHYLDDIERGTVWEESIIFCPAHIHILALSATIPNIAQIATWMKKVHKFPLEIVAEYKRPVPLEHRFQCENKIFMHIQQLKKNSCLSHKAKRHHKLKQNKLLPNKITTLLEHLQNNSELPAIYFAFSRNRCEKLAFEICHEFNLLNNNEKDKLILLFKNLLKRYDLAKEPSAEKLWPLIKKGIGYHHAGLLPSLKEVIEQLFTSRLLKLIFTTETFALGINMPAKTVIFDELRKFYGYYHANLRCRDYFQMAGRAGRRGIDKQGFVYSRINPKYMEIDQVGKIIFGQPEPITSQFNLSYASSLHLYKKWQERLYEVYPLTLHYFQSSKKARQNALSLLKLKISLLKELNYINNNQITEKGEFACRLYGYELPITELFSLRILENLNSIGLNIVLTALVFEPRKNELHLKLPGEILKIQKMITPAIESIVKLEKKYRIFPLSKTPYFNLAYAIERWSLGDDFLRTKKATSVDEGEIVRYFRMVIQILRQLHTIPSLSPVFRKVIEEALHSINRDEVDAEKQLREGF